MFSLNEHRAKESSKYVRQQLCLCKCFHKHFFFALDFSDTYACNEVWLSSKDRQLTVNGAKRVMLLIFHSSCAKRWKNCYENLHKTPMKSKLKCFSHDIELTIDIFLDSPYSVGVSWQLWYSHLWYLQAHLVNIPTFIQPPSFDFNIPYSVQ